jgi:hypothetical protein
MGGVVLRVVLRHEAPSGNRSEIGGHWDDGHPGRSRLSITEHPGCPYSPMVVFPASPHRGVRRRDQADIMRARQHAAVSSETARQISPVRAVRISGADSSGSPPKSPVCSLSRSEKGIDRAVAKSVLPAHSVTKRADQHRAQKSVASDRQAHARLRGGDDPRTVAVRGCTRERGGYVDRSSRSDTNLTQSRIPSLARSSFSQRG